MKIEQHGTIPSRNSDGTTKNIEFAGLLRYHILTNYIAISRTPHLRLSLSAGKEKTEADSELKDFVEESSTT